jgi:hypothetical protein
VVVRVLNRFLTGFSKKEVRELEEFLRRILANSKTELQKDKEKEMEDSA